MKKSYTLHNINSHLNTENKKEYHRVNKANELNCIFYCRVWALVVNVIHHGNYIVHCSTPACPGNFERVPSNQDQGHSSP